MADVPDEITGARRESVTFRTIRVDNISRPAISVASRAAARPLHWASVFDRFCSRCRIRANTRGCIWIKRGYALQLTAARLRRFTRKEKEEEKKRRRRKEKEGKEKKRKEKRKEKEKKKIIIPKKKM